MTKRLTRVGNSQALVIDKPILDSWASRWKPHHNSSCMRKAFLDCRHEIGVHRSFSSHGRRRTANDLIRRVASGKWPGRSPGT